MTREEAIFVLECVEAYGLADDAKRMAIEALKAKPRHGHWVHKHDDIYDYYECSVCGRWVDPIPNPYMVLKAFPYCHCGARMVKVELENGEEIRMDEVEE